jgi:hypothetical protein
MSFGSQRKASIFWARMSVRIEMGVKGRLGHYSSLVLESIDFAGLSFLSKQSNYGFLEM